MKQIPSANVASLVCVRVRACVRASVTCVRAHPCLCGHNWDVVCQGNTNSIFFFSCSIPSIQSLTVMGVFA